MKRLITKKLPVLSLSIAMILLSTSVFSFPFLLVTGYINLGDSMIFTISAFLSPSLSAIVSALGSALADIILGYSFYIPATVLAKGIMAAIFSYIIHKKKKASVANYIMPGCLMVLIYFVFEILIYDYSLALANIIGNIVQVTINSLVSILIINKLKRIHFEKHIDLS